MNIFSRIAFPAAVIAMTAAAASTPSREAPAHRIYATERADTVIYPKDGYKQGRVGTMPDEKVPDSLLRKAGIKVNIGESWDEGDTTAVRDSLGPEELAKRKADSIERAKTAYRDSISEAKAEAKAVRDSIRDAKPRVLETFALPDSMQYKRLIQWKLDHDFQYVKPTIPDTSYNYHYNDYPFKKEDLNATWLGVSGSPVQTYNYFKRGKTDEGVEFYRTQESWAYSPQTFPNYNTKTPYTELAYYGTLIAGKQKESNNIHLMTTQNILPEFNFTLLYDSHGGEGILQHEKTTNRVFGVGLNYLGKRYMGHLGYVGNIVSREENGGVCDVSEIRDTTLEARELNVRLRSADSKVKKHSVYLDNQLRIPFNFIEKMKARKDSTYTAPDENLVDKDITTAFIGQSTEFSMYSRRYNDKIGAADTYARAMYSDESGEYITNYDTAASADSLGASKLDNRLFLRLQPWSSQGIVSSIDVGIGDRLMMYGYGPKTDVRKATENSFFLYAGAKGQFRQYLSWDALMHYNVLGDRIGDFDISANVLFNTYPFRKARKSPLSISASFKQTLQEPNFYQEHFYSNHYAWDNNFKKVSTTMVEGRLEIPHWKLDASVGYAILGNGTFYDNCGYVRQKENAVNIVTASLRKDFTLWKMLHLDNRVLVQWSSDEQVVPLPLCALNLRWYIEFVVKRDKLRQPVMRMQIGLNALYNTPWHAPAWNPVTGTFQNQNERSYTNGPFFDVFVNVQWKRACVFIKFENAGMGWPLKKGKDYFSADRYIITERGLKFGIYWPFYILPNRNKPVSFNEKTR